MADASLDIWDSDARSRKLPVVDCVALADAISAARVSGSAIDQRAAPKKRHAFGHRERGAASPRKRLGAIRHP